VSGALDLGPGWAPIEFSIDDADGLVRVGQEDRGIYFLKDKLPELLARLEALAKTTRG
jgi:hypothetical protein